MKYPFKAYWHIRPLAWNIPTNSKARLKHALDFRGVCALVAHHQAEVAVCV